MKTTQPRRFGSLGAAALIALSAFCTSESRADCREAGGFAVLGGAVFGTLPAAIVGTFVAPAIAVAADDSLSYGGGVAWSAVGAFSFGGTTTGLMLIDCPSPTAIYLPGVMALAGSALTTSLWAVASSEDDPNPPFALGIEPQIGDGAVVTLSGQF